MPKTILLYYGEMGSGKSYRAKTVAGWLDIPFIEGDDLMSPEMCERVGRFLPPTEEQIQELIDAVVLAVASSNHFELTIAQALYRKRHRDQLVTELERLGYHVQLMLVRPGFWRNLRQLWSRPRRVRWILYWLASKPWFEPGQGDQVVSWPLA